MSLNLLWLVCSVTNVSISLSQSQPYFQRRRWNRSWPSPSILPSLLDPCLLPIMIAMMTIVRSPLRSCSASFLRPFVRLERYYSRLRHARPLFLHLSLRPAIPPAPLTWLESCGKPPCTKGKAVAVGRWCCLPPSIYPSVRCECMQK